MVSISAAEPMPPQEREARPWRAAALSALVSPAHPSRAMLAEIAAEQLAKSGPSIAFEALML